MKRRKTITAKMEHELQMVRSFEKIVTEVKEESIGPRKARNRITKELRELMAYRSRVEREALISPLLNTYREELTTYLQLLNIVHGMTEITELRDSTKLLRKIHQQRVTALEKALVDMNLISEAHKVYSETKAKILTSANKKRSNHVNRN